MMAPEGAEDTSLAMPSDNSLSSGQQRVLSQVFSMKRSKSRYNKSNSTSPTSPAPPSYRSYNDTGTFKYRAASTYNRSNSTPLAGFKGRSKSVMTKSTRGRHAGSNMERVSTSSWPKSPNGVKPSRSDPALVSASTIGPAANMKVKGQSAGSQHNIQTVIRESSSMLNGMVFTERQMLSAQPSSSHSLTDGKLGTFRASKVEQTSMGNMPSSGLIQAVEELNSDNYVKQVNAVSLIQHECYKDESAKVEVYKLDGIPLLVNMLESEDSKLQQLAAGALRNLVFRNFENKVAVQKLGGIAKVLNLLKKTDSTETKTQLAGVLWNLSAADELKSELAQTALPALTENVVVPFTHSSESDANIDPYVFQCATACLRNLSSSNEENVRKSMRECNRLVESLVKHVTSSVLEDKGNEKSVENCMCILHNLSYNLGNECSETEESSDSLTKTLPVEKENSTVGCFSPRSLKAQNEVSVSKPPAASPSMEDCLLSSSTINAYILVLSSTTNDATMEACFGTLQNLTATTKEQAEVMCENLFAQLYSKNILPSTLRSSQKAVRKYSVVLVENMSRKPNLYYKMAERTLPELTELLRDQSWTEETPDTSIETVCTTVHRLLQVDPKYSKKVITKELVVSLSALSERDPGRGTSNAASQLLYDLWAKKSLKKITKKLKMDRTRFVNSNTIVAATHKNSTAENPTDKDSTGQQ